MPRLLREVGWEVESDEFTEIEDPDPDNHDERQRELINEIEEARRQLAEKPEKKSRFSFFKKKAAGKKEWETYEEKAKGSGGPEEGEVRGEELEKRAEGVLFDIDAIRKEVKDLAGDGEFEVKQLESTLPPMRISISNSPDPGPRSPLRATKSYNDGIDSSPLRSEHGYATNGQEEITMSFDTPLTTPRKSPMLAPSPEIYEDRPAMKSHNTSPLVERAQANMSLDHNAWADEDEFGGEHGTGEITMTFG